MSKILPDTLGELYAGFQQAVLKPFYTLLQGSINATLGALTVNTVSNAAGQTITAAQIAARIYIATPRGAAQTATTDTTANLYSALQTATNFSSTQMLAGTFRFRYINGSANSVTVGAGTGVTLSGAGASAVAAGVWQDYLITFQSTTTCTFTSIGKGTYA